MLGLFTLSQFFLSFAIHRYPHVLGYAASRISPDEIIHLTDLERQNQGLLPLKYNSQLSQAAAQKAADMFAKDYWAHVSPSGTQPWYFITQSNYSYRYAGENLARDFSDPQAVIKAWLASPSHRENLLSDKYQDIGVAVVDGKLGGQETTLVVQMFGTKLSAMPLAKLDVKSATDTISKAPATSITLPSPSFIFTKYLAILFLGIFASVLIIDIITVYRRQISRWTSKSFAHLAFMTVLLVAVTLLSAGQII